MTPRAGRGRRCSRHAGRCRALPCSGSHVLDEVADVQRAHPAGFHARRQLAVLGAVDAEHALADGAHLLRHRVFRGRMLERVLVARRLRVVEVAGAVRARRHAHPAADAAVLVDEDDAVAGLERRRHRADPEARRVLALEARARHVVFAALRVFDLEDLDPLETCRELVLLLARFRALLAAVALAKVDDHRPLPRLRRRLRGLGKGDRDEPCSERRAAETPEGPDELPPGDAARHSAGLLPMRSLSARSGPGGASPKDNLRGRAERPG